MKPALYYAVDASGYRDRVIAVTTEKRAVWHGRDCTDNTATHGRMGALTGRFDTLEQAQERVAGVSRIRAKHAPLQKAANDAVSAAWYAEQNEIAEFLKQPVQP